MAYTSDTKCLSPCCPANNYQSSYEGSEDSIASETPTNTTDSEGCCNELTCENFSKSSKKMYHHNFETYNGSSSVIKKQSKCAQKYNNDFQNYYEERTDFMSKKFNDLSLKNDMSSDCKVCPVHSKTARRKNSDIYTIEETYWAMWKPNKKNSDVTVEKKSEPIIPRFDASPVPNHMSIRSNVIKSLPPVKEIPMPNVNLNNYIQCRKCMKYIEKNTNPDCYKCNNLQNDSIESLNRKHNTINEDDEDATHEECESGGLETMDDATDISLCSKSRRTDKSRKSRLSTASSRSSDKSRESNLQNKSRDSVKGKIAVTDYLNKFMNVGRPKSPSYGIRQENKENVCNDFPNCNDTEMNYKQSPVRNCESPRSPTYIHSSGEGSNYELTQELKGNSNESDHLNEGRNDLVDSRQNLDTAVFQVLKEKLRSSSNVSPKNEYNIQTKQNDEDKGMKDNLNNKDILLTDTTEQTPNKTSGDNKVVPNKTSPNSVNTKPLENFNTAANSQNNNLVKVDDSPEIIVTKSPAIDFEVNSNPVDENEIHSVDYNNIQELEVITLKHTNSYIRKLIKSDEPVKTYTQPPPLKLSTMNRVNMIRPHSYPLKPILKKEKKFIPTSRPQLTTKNFSFKYKQ